MLALFFITQVVYSQVPAKRFQRGWIVLTRNHCKLFQLKQVNLHRGKIIQHTQKEKNSKIYSTKVQLWLCALF